jgi:hypothetical protein
VPEVRAIRGRNYSLRITLRADATILGGLSASQKLCAVHNLDHEYHLEVISEGMTLKHWQSCPLSVRELPPTAAKVRQGRGGTFQCLVGLSWVELLGVGREFPLLTGGL